MVKFYIPEDSMRQELDKFTLQQLLIMHNKTKYYIDRFKKYIINSDENSEADRLSNKDHINCITRTIYIEKFMDKYITEKYFTEIN